MLNVHVSLSPLYFFHQPILGVSDVEITPNFMHFLKRKGKEKRGQCNRYLAVHTLCLRRIRVLLWGERKRGIEHVYSISQRRAPEGKREKQSVRYKKK